MAENEEKSLEGIYVFNKYIEKLFILLLFESSV
jgi:hypothetical protein